MPKKPLPPEVEELIKTYQQSQINLINMIATKQAKGNVTAYRKSILASVNQELATLNKYAEGWAKEVIPKAYETGAASTYAEFRKKNINVAKVAVNQKVVNTLVNNTIGQLEDASAFVGRRINDEVRKAGLAAISQKVTTGSTVKQAKANLIDSLTKKGITAIRDKNGREIALDAYASTVARTTTREATNKGAIQTSQDLGNDLVQITSHSSSCPVCIVYEGKVYSISGKSKDYPPLSGPFSGGYSTIHPNCFIDAQVPIYTSKGWVGIGKLKVGDLVLSHKGKFRKVTKLHRNMGKGKIVEILASNSLDCYGGDAMTANHPLMINGEWKKAIDAKVGDKVRMLKFESTTEFEEVKIIEVSEGELKQEVTLYNISVDIDESYIANGFVVHNCGHSVVPYFAKYDPNAEELKKKSNEPLKVNDKQQKQIDNYNKQQAAKTKLRNERKEWEAAKMAAPNETPKTLSGFKSVKKADGTRYANIKAAIPSDNVAKAIPTKSTVLNMNDHSEQWYKSLVPNEKAVIADYTSGNGMDILNYHRRRDYFENLDNVPKEYIGELKDRTNLLDSAIEKYGGLDKDVVMYRGVGNSYWKEVFDIDEEQFYDKEYISKKLLGKTVTDKAYMSMSLDIEEAEYFASSPLISFDVPKGTKGAFIGKSSAISDQDEFLLARNSKVKFNKIRVDEEMGLIVEAEIIK